MAAASGLLVTLLAVVFAWLQNPRPTAPPPTPPVVAASSVIEAGRAVWTAQDCAMCHAVAGVGNPRSPLDGVGARLDATALRDWTFATGSAEGELSASVRGVKRAYRELPSDELEALIAYLQSLL